MAANRSDILDAAAGGLAAQESELAALRARQPLLIVGRTATGTGNVDHAFTLDRAFRLVFVRCHFSGTPGVAAALAISVDSAGGSAYDARLFTITRAGVGRDVNLRITDEESAEPSPWTFQPGDALRVQWTNPDDGNITWGLEVGLAVAS